MVRTTELVVDSQLQQHQLTLHQLVQGIAEAMEKHASYQEEQEQQLRKVIADKQ